MNHNTVRLAMLVVLGVAGHARHIEAAVVLVSSYRWNHVKEYDFETGQYLRTLVPSSGGGLSQAGEIALGPGQDVYVSSLGNNRICHYDESSGAFLGAIGVGIVSGPRGLAFGPDHRLYVSSSGTHTIQRYDPNSGQFLGTFASASGAPIGLAFGRDGNLYAAIADLNRVERFDGTTGQSLGFFTPATYADNTQSLAFGPDGDLYVHSQYNNRVIQYDGETGTYKRIFVQRSYPFNPSAGMAFGPDGNLYTTNLTAGHTVANDGVDRYDGGTGQFLDHFIDAQPHGSYWSSGIAIYEPVPEPSTLALLGIGVLGLLGWACRRRPRLGGSRCAIVHLVGVLACIVLAADQALAGPTIVTTGISTIMVPPAIDWHDRILYVHIRDGVRSFVTCSEGQVLDTFQVGQSLFGWKLSQYGVAYVQDYNLYVRPAGGQSQFVHSAIAGIGCLSMNDSGTVCYASRDTNHHDLREMWIRQPDQSPVQLPAPASGEVTVGKMAVSSTGNVYAGISITDVGSGIYRWSDQGWTNLTAGMPASATFAAMNCDASQIVFWSSEPGYLGFYQLCGDTISRLGITYPTFASPTVKVADNGNVLVYWYSVGYFGVPAKAYLYRPDGSVIDLDTVLPAGQSLATSIDNGRLDMNHDGQVLLEGFSKDSTGSIYDYYRYDGIRCDPFLEVRSKPVLSPAICDDGLMYYYFWDSSGGTRTLTMAAIPEPASLAIFVPAGVALLAWRYKTRCRNNRHTQS